MPIFRHVSVSIRSDPRSASSDLEKNRPPTQDPRRKSRYSPQGLSILPPTGSRALMRKRAFITLCGLLLAFAAFGEGGALAQEPPPMLPPASPSAPSAPGVPIAQPDHPPGPDDAELPPWAQRTAPAEETHWQRIHRWVAGEFEEEPVPAHVWLKAEYLFAWIRADHTPPLLTTGVTTDPTPGADRSALHERSLRRRNRLPGSRRNATHPRHQPQRAGFDRRQLLLPRWPQAAGLCRLARHAGDRAAVLQRQHRHAGFVADDLPRPPLGGRRGRRATRSWKGRS